MSNPKTPDRESAMTTEGEARDVDELLAAFQAACERAESWERFARYKGSREYSDACNELAILRNDLRARLLRSLPGEEAGETPTWTAEDRAAMDAIILAKATPLLASRSSVEPPTGEAGDAKRGKMHGVEVAFEDLPPEVQEALRRNNDEDEIPRCPQSGPARVYRGREPLASERRAGREITDATIHDEMRVQLDHVIRHAKMDGCGRVAVILAAIRDTMYA